MALHTRIYHTSGERALIGDILFIAKEALVNIGGWIVTGSSDGAVGLMDGVDRITSPDSILVNNSWICIESPHAQKTDRTRILISRRNVKSSYSDFNHNGTTDMPTGGVGDNYSVNDFVNGSMSNLKPVSIHMAIEDSGGYQFHVHAHERMKPSNALFGMFHSTFEVLPPWSKSPQSCFCVRFCGRGRASNNIIATSITFSTVFGYDSSSWYGGRLSAPLEDGTQSKQVRGVTYGRYLGSSSEDAGPISTLPSWPSGASSGKNGEEMCAPLMIMSREGMNVPNESDVGATVESERFVGILSDFVLLNGFLHNDQDTLASESSQYDRFCTKYFNFRWDGITPTDPGYGPDKDS